MDSLKIEKAFRSDDAANEVLVGVFAADTLPSPKEFTGAYVANTQPSAQVATIGLHFSAPRPNWSVSIVLAATLLNTQTTY